MNDVLTKIIDSVFPHQPDFKDEKLFWDNHWDKMLEYYKKYGEIFEIRDKWDSYCNEALHQHYKSVVKDFSNLRCIECGSGGGYESALMANDGALVTVLDYSDKAIEYAKLVGQRVGVFDNMKFVCEDILNFQPKNKYDLVWNCGVIEHYNNEDIIRIIKKMKSFVKDNGLIVVTIPNLLSPQSIYWMLTTGKGSERYISRRGLINLMEAVGLRKVNVKTFNYWLPSFLPITWAVKTSKWRIVNQLGFATWLFSGIGFKRN